MMAVTSQVNRKLIVGPLSQYIPWKSANNSESAKNTAFHPSSCVLAPPVSIRAAFHPDIISFFALKYARISSLNSLRGFLNVNG
jgi:hypothetical protein